MRFKSLDILLGTRHVGVLFQYTLAPDQVLNRFVANEAYATDPDPPRLSTAFDAGDLPARAAFWAAVTGPTLNGVLSSNPARGWLLPAFFQNLLPEGPLRTRIAEIRGCSVHDHFELLAATGADLPGDVHAHPSELTRSELQRLITLDNDALEMSVVAQPVAGAISVSGVQSKLMVLKVGDRFVGRTKITDPSAEVLHVIAKLPVVQHPKLPELEELSLRLARAAGVSAVTAELAPLRLLEEERGYDLGDVDGETQFLAVHRYDRDADTPTRRVHCEDFAQILNVQPENKYSLDYLTVAGVMLDQPALGEPAVHELLRRILVNDLLGNQDMHLKNMGLRYPDGVTPELPPAYDIVGYGAYSAGNRGRAIHLVPPGTLPAIDPMAPLNAAVVRAFCTRLGIPEKPAISALRQCADKAFNTWPALIEASGITDKMKAQLLTRLWARAPKRAASAARGKRGIALE